MQRRQLLPILLPYSTENGAGVTLRTAKLAGPLEAASRRSGDAITEATKTVGEALGASARQLEAETDKLSIRAGAIASTLEQVVAKLRAMQTPDRVIEVRLEPITDSLTQSVDRFAAQSVGRQPLSRLPSRRQTPRPKSRSR